ncbi:MAG: alpha/beta fold hydrolase [Pseudomonadota bacterium]
MKPLRILALCVALAGCATPDGSPLSPPADGATVYPIEVVTTRVPQPDTSLLFGSDRNAVLTYARANVSIPPDHVTGQIAYPVGDADAARTFAITGVRPYRSFAEMNAAMPAEPEVVLYVHGFNNTVAEAAFQLAQIRHDFGVDQPTVLFAWPSAGDVRGYLYDRDSVLFARGDLVETLRNLTRDRRVLIVAHSMGSLLTMEALRQLALEGDRRPISRVSGLMLVSPDIDSDLFRRQAADIGRLPQPFVIFVAQEDRALTLSGFLTGRRERLGNISSVEDIGDLPVAVVDLSAFAARRGLNHQIALESPAAISLLRSLREDQEDGVGPGATFARLAPYLLNAQSQAGQGGLEIAGLQITGPR